MSGLTEISLDEEIQFLKYFVIPSFAPRLKFGSDEEKRLEWMRLEAEKYLTKEKADELMDRFGIVSTLDEAEKTVLEAKQERQQQTAAPGGNLFYLGLLSVDELIVCFRQMIPICKS